MAKQSLTGQADIKVSEDKQEVDLTFTKSKDGEEWSTERIVDLLKSGGITFGYKVEDITKQLKIIAEKKEDTVTVTLATGLPPEPMTAEEPEWKELVIPEGAIEAIEKKLKESPRPEIQKEITIKVKKKKKVLKKSKIPFQKPKEEEVEYSETEKKFEKIYIDPTVESFGYAIEGQTIALVYPSKPGTPGRDVFDDAIPPQQIPDPFFHAGKSITKKGSELLAEISGIVRKGTNWVDMVPFEIHEWSLLLSDDRANCLINFKPGDKNLALPSMDEIKAKAEELDYPLEQLDSESEIHHLLKESIESASNLTEVPISGTEDAYYTIEIDEDNLKASLHMRKGRGHGKQLDLKEVGKAIREANLKLTSKDTVRDEILAFYKSPDTELTDYVLAQGRAPKEGPAQVAEYSVRILDEKELLETKENILAQQAALKGIDGNEEFPLEAIDALAPVEQDQRILALSPVQKGEPGMDVFGEAIEGLPGHQYNYHCFGDIDRKDNIIIATDNGIFERAIVDDDVYIRVRKHQDADIEVELTPDELEAYISLSPSEGTGKPLSDEFIQKEIQNADVKSGIDEQLLKKIISQAKEGQSVKRLKFAQGNAAIAGGEERLEFIIEFAQKNSVTLRKDGTADYRARDNITMVNKDQEIAKIYPATGEAKEGLTVTGKKINPEEMKAVVLELGENVREEKNNEGIKTIFADAEGELVYDKNKLSVSALHTLKGDVDMKSGNIKFPGNVHISGSVNSGFVVMSGNDVMIGGSVERALISSGGKIFIKEGVKGGGKALLRAKDDIEATFIEQATVLSVGEIRIEKSLLRSNIKCNTKLVLSEKGAIIGGVIKARKGVETGSLGSERGIGTKIFFGQDYLVEDQIHVEEKEIKKITEEIAKTDAAVNKQKKLGAQDQMQKLFARKTKLLKLMEKRNLRLFTLKEKFEEHFDSSIIVKGKIFPGVIMESHGRDYEVRDIKENVTFTFDTKLGRIIEADNKSN